MDYDEIENDDLMCPNDACEYKMRGHCEFPAFAYNGQRQCIYWKAVAQLLTQPDSPFHRRLSGYTRCGLVNCAYLLEPGICALRHPSVDIDGMCGDRCVLHPTQLASYAYCENIHSKQHKHEDKTICYCSACVLCQPDDTCGNWTHIQINSAGYCASRAKRVL